MTSLVPVNLVEELFGPEYLKHDTFVVPGESFVVVAVTLQNGFILTGEAGRVYPCPVDELEQEAAENAFRKSGPLAAFRELDRINNPHKDSP